MNNPFFVEKLKNESFRSIKERPIRRCKNTKIHHDLRNWNSLKRLEKLRFSWENRFTIALQQLQNK